MVIGEVIPITLLMGGLTTRMRGTPQLLASTGQDDLTPTAMKQSDTMNAPTGNDLQAACLSAYGQRGAGLAGATQPGRYGSGPERLRPAKPPGGTVPPAVRFEASAAHACRAILRLHSRLGDGKW
jgi:hypothetical protein